MSAIAAIFERRRTSAALPLSEQMERMLDRLAHRAPDGVSHWVGEGVALGHGLLRTGLEPSSAKQPLRGRQSAGWIVADARIDNRDELVAHRAKSGQSAEVGSDADLLLWAYETWGTACVSKLIGDFAFVLWDARRKRLVCGRDPIGVRSLYYQADADAVRIASEPEALFADPRVARRPHRLAMGLLLFDEYTERDQTLYEGVFAVPPGHLVVVGGEGVSVERYYRPNSFRETRYARSEEYVDHFAEILTSAVACRLPKSSPVGLHASGGIDSSAVIGVVESLRKTQRIDSVPLLLTLTHPGLPCDETEFASALASHWNVPHALCDAVGDMSLCRPEISSLFPDVYFDPTVLGMRPILEEGQRRGIRVQLTGLGADQLMFRSGQACEDHLRSGELTAATRAARIESGRRSPNPWRVLGRSAVRSLVPRSLHPWIRMVRGRVPALPDWFDPALAADVLSHLADARARADRERYRSLASKIVIESLLGGRDVTLPLSQADRLTAHYGTEFRHPFFDLRVVEYLLSIPDEWRTGRDLSKPLLRRAMAKNGWAPPSVYERSCTAEFTCYCEKALFGEHWAIVRQLLEKSRAERIGLVDARRLQQVVDRKMLHEISALTKLELWLRQSIPEENHGPGIQLGRQGFSRGDASGAHEARVPAS